MPWRTSVSSSRRTRRRSSPTCASRLPEGLVSIAVHCTAPAAKFPTKWFSLFPRVIAGPAASSTNNNPETPFLPTGGRFSSIRLLPPPHYNRFLQHDAQFDHRDRIDVVLVSPRNPLH